MVQVVGPIVTPQFVVRLHPGLNGPHVPLLAKVVPRNVFVASNGMIITLKMNVKISLFHVMNSHAKKSANVRPVIKTT